ncbi:MAG: hypothetical protein HYU77_01730 [Betaproteobacteria bacterium]|nr:hypothetical protein [Betaproteobacteria bacterium]
MRRILASVMTGTLLGGCVTINIYFPAAAAEKAADRIIEEVWQLQKSETRPAPAARPDPETPAQPGK